MGTRTLRWLLGATVGICGAADLFDGPHPALATPARDFTTVSTRSFFQTIRASGGADAQGHARIRIVADMPADVYVVTNTVLPGGNSGWHTHSGPSIVAVKSGTATVYDGNDPSCTPMIYPAGTGFVDAGGGHVHMVRNAGNVQLELIAFQMIPAGAQRRIDAPNPGFCPNL
jgi:mannose-6-phosphate isomerase-like protein (cupin superfamily)